MLNKNENQRKKNGEKSLECSIVELTAQIGFERERASRLALVEQYRGEV